jgi:hypothetical protein
LATFGFTFLDHLIGAGDRVGGDGPAERWVVDGGKGSSVSKPIAGEARAILIDVPALERWKLLSGLAVAISRTTAVYASLFGGLSRCDCARSKIGIPSIKCPRTQREECEEYKGNGKRPLGIFHGPAPLRSQNTASLKKLRGAPG